MTERISIREAAIDPVLTPDEVAAALKVSRETVRKMLASGKLAWVPVGMGESRQCRRVRKSTLDEYLRNEKLSSVGQEMNNVKRTFSAMKMVEEHW